MSGGIDYRRHFAEQNAAVRARLGIAVKAPVAAITRPRPPVIVAADPVPEHPVIAAPHEPEPDPPETREEASAPIETLTPRRKALELVGFISREYDVTRSDIFSLRRSQRVVRARHHLMWLLRHETNWSLPMIGRFLGRDHSSVIHGVERHAERDAEEAAKGLKPRDIKATEYARKLNDGLSEETMKVRSMARTQRHD